MRNMGFATPMARGPWVSVRCQGRILGTILIVTVGTRCDQLERLGDRGGCLVPRCGRCRTTGRETAVASKCAYSAEGARTMLGNMDYVVKVPEGLDPTCLF